MQRGSDSVRCQCRVVVGGLQGLPLSPGLECRRRPRGRLRCDTSASHSAGCAGGGAPAQTRRLCEDLLRQWTDADPDFPLLLQVEDRLARLGK